MKNGCIKKAVLKYSISGIKTGQSFLRLLYVSLQAEEARILKILPA